MFFSLSLSHNLPLFLSLCTIPCSTVFTSRFDRTVASFIYYCFHHGRLALYRNKTAILGLSYLVTNYDCFFVRVEHVINCNGLQRYFHISVTCENLFQHLYNYYCNLEFRLLLISLEIHFEDDEINQFFSIFRNHIPPGTWWSASLEPCTAASSSDTCPHVSQE